jgi:Lon protease-like protein
VPARTFAPRRIKIFSFLGKKKSANERASELPLFPLATTLFPGGRTALNVFEQRYYELAKNCIATGEGFGIVTLLGGSEVGAQQSYAKVGEQRFEVLSTRTRSNGLHVAQVRWLPNEPSVPISPEYASLVDVLKPLVDALGATRFAEPFALNDSTWVGSRLSEIIKMPPTIKQSLLEINDPELRLKIIAQLMKKGQTAAS